MQRLSRRFSGNLFLYAVIVQIVFEILYNVGAYIDPYLLNSSATLFVLFFRLLIYLPPILIIAIRKYPVSRILRLNAFPPRQTFFIAGISICIYLFVILFGTMFENMLRSFVDPYMNLNYFSGRGFSLWPALLTSCFIPAVLYELMFRGVVQSGFSDIAPFKACLFVGLLYGLMFSNTTDFIPYAVFGFVLSYISIKTGSIISSIITSFLYQLFKLIGLNGLIYRYVLSPLGFGENIIAFVLIIISIIICGILLKSMPDTSRSARPLHMPSSRRIMEALREFRHKLQLSYLPDDTEGNETKPEYKKSVADESFDKNEAFPDDSPKQNKDTGFIIGGVILAAMLLISFGISVYSLVQAFS